VGIAQSRWGTADRAFIALDCARGPDTENHLGDEGQRQSSRDCQPSGSAAHERPPFLSSASGAWTAQPGPPIHCEPQGGLTYRVHASTLCPSIYAGGTTVKKGPIVAGAVLALATSLVIVPNAAVA